MSTKKTALERLTEKSVANELHKAAESVMGKMEDVRENTSLEFFVKFYRFYLGQMPKKPEGYREWVKGSMCVTLCNRIIDRATSLHDISKGGFVAMTKTQ